MSDDRGRHIVNLRDIGNHAHRAVNLAGIVVEFSIPHKSKGTDYCTSLKIMDKDQQSPELCVNVFMRSIGELPHIRSHKDIIILCDVQIQLYEQNFSAILRNASSFALFDGRISDECSTYQVSSRFQLLGSDKEIVRGLRIWSSTFPFDAGLSDYIVPMKDFGQKGFVDLVCQVVHVCKLSSSRWMLFVWDGSDAPALSLDSKLADEEQTPLVLHIEPLQLPRDILRTFPHVGTVLRVVADQVYENLGDHFGGIGNWVRFRNLQCKTDSGLWKGVLGPATKLRPLSRNDSSVEASTRYFSDRISKRGRIPSSCSLTSPFLTAVTGDREADYATLMDVLTSPLNDSKFKCIVRVVAVYPSQIKDFRSPLGEYRVRLTLEDPTARLHAGLSFDDAEEFFRGYADIDVFTAKMNQLLGAPESGEGPRNPPWTEFGIRLQPFDEDDVLDSRRYHVCGTRLV